MRSLEFVINIPRRVLLHGKVYQGEFYYTGKYTKESFITRGSLPKRVLLHGKVYQGEFYYTGNYTKESFITQEIIPKRVLLHGKIYQGEFYYTGNYTKESFITRESLPRRVLLHRKAKLHSSQTATWLSKSVLWELSITCRKIRGSGVILSLSHSSWTLKLLKCLSN